MEKLVLKYKGIDIEIENGKRILDIIEKLQLKNRKQLIAVYINDILHDLHTNDMDMLQ